MVTVTTSWYTVCKCAEKLEFRAFAEKRRIRHMMSANIRSYNSLCSWKINLDKVVVRTLHNLKPLILLHSAALLRINEPFAGNFKILQKPSSRIRIKLQPKISTLCIFRTSYVVRVRPGLWPWLLLTYTRKMVKRNFWSSGPEVIIKSSYYFLMNQITQIKISIYICNTFIHMSLLYTCSMITITLHKNIPISLRS